MIFRDRYDFHETIGQGGFAKVKLATHKLTRERVAVKIIDRKMADENMIRVDLEIKAMKELCHPNICELYELYENDTKIFLVQEYCSGGELFEYIVANDKVPEDNARIFFRQILSAVGYIHSKGYAHRDLKPENLLLNENGHVKITDFGLCAKPEGGMRQALSTRCGSPCYIAPEILEGHRYFGSQSDVWSLGVLLFALVAGCLPYEGDNVTTILHKIKREPLVIPDHVSKNCRRLLLKMLEHDPDCRASIDELCIDPWVTNCFSDVPVLCVGNEERSSLDMDIVKFLSEQIFLSADATKIAIQQNQFDFVHAAYLIMLSMKKRGTIHKMERFHRYRFESHDKSFDPVPPPGSCTYRLVCSCEEGACLARANENESPVKRDETSCASPLKMEIRRFLMDRSICAVKRKKTADSSEEDVYKRAKGNDGNVTEPARSKRTTDSSDVRGGNRSVTRPRPHDKTAPTRRNSRTVLLPNESTEDPLRSPQRKQRRPVLSSIERGINAAVKRILSPIKKTADKRPLLGLRPKRGPRTCKTVWCSIWTVIK